MKVIAFLPSMYVMPIECLHITSCLNWFHERHDVSIYSYCYLIAP